MTGAQTFVRNGLMQTDLDANNFRIINLDTSNLPPSGIPPTIHPATNLWLHDWDASTLTWTATQPNFTALAGNLTSAQQNAITQLGTIRTGVWQGSTINQFYLPTLDLISAPLADLSVNNFKITDLANPVDPGDAVNKNFMDLLLQGLNPKQAVRVATTAVSPLAGLAPVDGVALSVGDRVLVKNMGSPPLRNGIWVAAVGAWTRATDCDHGSGDAGFTSQNSIDKGAYCVVLEGSTQGGTSWFQTDSVVHILSDPNEWVIFSNAQNILAGQGLYFTGNTLNAKGTLGRIAVGAAIDIDPLYSGQTTITTLGLVSTGTWNGTIIDGTHGGTGVNNGPFSVTLQGSLQVTLGGFAIFGSLEFIVGEACSVNVPSSGILATVANPETFTNKRITKRFASTPSASFPTINTDNLDVFYITALATPILSMTTNLTGTPVDGDELEIWLKDAGTSKAITWGASFTASSDLPLPTATTSGKWLKTRFWWNSIIAKWVMIEKLDNI